jgi:5'-nucleotidase
MPTTPHILITAVGRPYYWIGGPAPTVIEEEGTDIWAIAHGYISVIPIQLDLTAHGVLETVQAWGLMLQ